MKNIVASALNGSNPGLTLMIKTRAGKTHSVMLSRFEETEEILANLQRIAQAELESLAMGTFGAKWPETL